MLSSPSRNHSGTDRGVTPSVREDHVREILRIVESESPHTIQDLAARLKLSLSHLEHVFKQETGLSLGRLLTERKLRSAADLLMHSRMCIKEIAYSVGYKHTSSFIRAFERYFARTPRSYRQQARPHE